jgi:hypothetical protein
MPRLKKIKNPDCKRRDFQANNHRAINVFLVQRPALPHLHH